MAGTLAEARPSQEAATILTAIDPASDAGQAFAPRVSPQYIFDDHAFAMTLARDAPMRATRCRAEVPPSKSWSKSDSTPAASRAHF
jgi:hypothetical protein